MCVHARPRVCVCGACACLCVRMCLYAIANRLAAHRLQQTCNRFAARRQQRRRRAHALCQRVHNGTGLENLRNRRAASGLSSLPYLVVPPSSGPVHARDSSLFFFFFQSPSSCKGKCTQLTKAGCQQGNIGVVPARHDDRTAAAPASHDDRTAAACSIAWSVFRGFFVVSPCSGSFGHVVAESVCRST